MKKRLVAILALAAVLIIFWLLVTQQENHESKADFIEPKEPTIQKAKPAKLAEKENISSKPLAQSEMVDKNNKDMSCNEFRNSHPDEERAFNAVLAEIYMDPDEDHVDNAFSNMDEVNLRALAKGGDKNALFWLGDQISTKAIFGSNVFSNKLDTKKPSRKEIELHRVKLDKLKEGSSLLFEAAVRGKLGAFLHLRTNSELAARQLSRTEPDSEEKIMAKLVESVAYRKLLGFIHEPDNSLSYMFGGNVHGYETEQLKRVFKSWKPELTDEDILNEINEVHKSASEKLISLKALWKSRRDYLGEPVQPKLLFGELEKYLHQVTERCF